MAHRTILAHAFRFVFAVARNSTACTLYAYRVDEDTIPFGKWHFWPIAAFSKKDTLSTIGMDFRITLSPVCVPVANGKNANPIVTLYSILCKMYNWFAFINHTEKHGLIVSMY